MGCQARLASGRVFRVSHEPGLSGLPVALQRRTVDAVPLALAIILQDSIDAPLPFDMADERQLAAARNCKLETIAVTRSKRVGVLVVAFLAQSNPTG